MSPFGKMLAAAAALALGAPAGAVPAKPLATIFKNPECACCEAYAEYLRKSGYKVKVIPTNDLALINQRQGIPAQLEGCHTMIVGGYFVGGHVPVKAINRLLSERPNINGITLPGMPAGSPGMSGPKMGPLKIYAVGKSGSAAVYEAD